MSRAVHRAVHQKSGDGRTRPAGRLSGGVSALVGARRGRLSAIQVKELQPEIFRKAIVGMG